MAETNGSGFSVHAGIPGWTWDRVVLTALGEQTNYTYWGTNSPRRDYIEPLRERREVLERLLLTMPAITVASSNTYVPYVAQGWRATIYNGVVVSNVVTVYSTVSCESGSGVFATNALTCGEGETNTGWLESSPMWWALGVQAQYVQYGYEATNAAGDWRCADAVFMGGNPPPGFPPYTDRIRSGTDLTRVMFDKCVDLEVARVDVYWAYDVNAVEDYDNLWTYDLCSGLNLTGCGSVAGPSMGSGGGVLELDYAAANIPVGSNILMMAGVDMVGGPTSVVVDVGVSNARWWPQIGAEACHVATPDILGVAEYCRGYGSGYVPFEFQTRPFDLFGKVRYWDKHDFEAKLMQVVVRWDFQYR
jgi:hypothetical protein